MRTLPSASERADGVLEEVADARIAARRGAGAAFPAGGFEREEIAKRAVDIVRLVGAGAHHEAIIHEAAFLPAQLLALLACHRTTEIVGALFTRREQRALMMSEGGAPSLAARNHHGDHLRRPGPRQIGQQHKVRQLRMLLRCGRARRRSRRQRPRGRPAGFRAAHRHASIRPAPATASPNGRARSAPERIRRASVARYATRPGRRRHRGRRPAQPRRRRPARRTRSARAPRRQARAIVRRSAQARRAAAIPLEIKIRSCRASSRLSAWRRGSRRRCGIRAGCGQS